MVEFALILPLLATLLFGTIQFGITFGGYNALINSVRETARYGSVCIGPASSCAAATSTYMSQKIPASGFAYDAASLKGKIQYQAYQEPPSTGKWNIRMRVTACVNSLVFIPLIGNLINPSNPSAFPLKSIETFRVEGAPTGVATTDPGIPQEPGWGTAATLPQGSC